VDSPPDIAPHDFEIDGDITRRQRKLLQCEGYGGFHRESALLPSSRPSCFAVE